MLLKFNGIRLSGISMQKSVHCLVAIFIVILKMMAKVF